ncbi:DUF5808 domain-containing protein [Phytoactinopolyspora halotolerans]|uniref:DUF5808 domain-containing protein n=1 Tax=Phytoactinopolyspora halotolerans TaxID=1981512 RepID=UPI001C208BC8|nr:DUF5808 domain-containing protein [Phytoactinopolyspora halotolerans]
MDKGRTLVTLGAAGLVAAAVAAELRKPADERTWEGAVGGLVPYDFRPPTMQRVRERMWAPDDPAIFTPHVFGVGWSGERRPDRAQARACVSRTVVHGRRLNPVGRPCVTLLSLPRQQGDLRPDDIRVRCGLITVR